MALWPNNRCDIAGFFPTNLFGFPAISEVKPNVQKKIVLFANGTIAPSSSYPEGTAQSRSCLIQPLVAGGMSSANGRPDAVMSLSGNALSGGPMEGDAAFLFDADIVNLSLIVGLDGTADVTLSAGVAVLALTISLAGTVTWTLTGDPSNLGLKVPCEGSGSFSLTGAADLKGLLSLEGNSTPFTELSPQSLASAVWGALAPANNAAGSMGEKLNDAGSGSNPWTEVIESGYTAADILRLLASLAAAQAAGGGTNSISFKDLAGSKTRVTLNVTNEEGDRTSPTIVDLT